MIRLPYEDERWFQEFMADRLEQIALMEMQGDDFQNWQELYRGRMESLSQDEPLDLDELLTGYNDAPEGLSGGAA